MGFWSDAVSAIPVVGQIASGFIDAGTQRKNVNKTIQANKDLAQYQYNKDVEMWNKANEYNSPVNQMERFKKAGLNPNLIYTQGNSGNTATALPKYQAPTVRYDYKPPVDPSSVIQRYQDFAVRQAQIDNMRKQKELTEAKIATEKNRPGQIEELILNYRKNRDLMGANIANKLFDLQLNTQFKPKLLQYQTDFARNKNFLSLESLRKLRLQNQLTSGTMDKVVRNWELRNTALDRGNQLKSKALDSYSYDLDLKAWDQMNRQLGVDSKAPWWVKALNLGISKVQQFQNSGGWVNGNRKY